MENLQIINFKFPQPALRDGGFRMPDVGFGMRNEIIFAKYSLPQLAQKKTNHA